MSVLQYFIMTSSLWSPQERTSSCHRMDCPWYISLTVPWMIQDKKANRPKDFYSTQIAVCIKTSNNYMRQESQGPSYDFQPPHHCLKWTRCPLKSHHTPTIYQTMWDKKLHHPTMDQHKHNWWMYPPAASIDYFRDFGFCIYTTSKPIFIHAN